MSYCGIFLTVEELHDKFGDITMVVGSLDELMPAAIAKAEELCWWVLLCKQAAKIFQTICKKETALKRVLRNLLSAISFAQI